MKERAWIRRYIAPLATAPGAAGLEDDVAALTNGSSLIATTDMLVEGRHFLRADPVDTIARKLVRVNVSDIISKGAWPVEALLSVAWPEARSETEFAAFMAALGDDLRIYGAELVGGDLTGTDGPLTLNLALTGRLLGQGVVRRSGAVPGQAVFVSGTIGAGWMGLQAARAGQDTPMLRKYREPELPPLSAAELVAAHGSASMDVSDGLLLDASRIADASGVGILIRLEDVPFAVPGRGLDELLAQCTGGDDYQILMTAAADARLPGFTQIGSVVEGHGLSVTFHDDHIDIPDRLGFEH